MTKGNTSSNSPASRPGSSMTSRITGAGNELPWLRDKTRAAQYLTRLTSETSAQGALITRRDSVWAFAGELTQDSATELAETAARYRDHRGESDLLRFVRLVSTNAEHMLYATNLPGGMVLVMVFNSETPFSTIRGQAGQLVRSLTTTPPAEIFPPPQAQETSPPGISFKEILTNVPSPNPVEQLESIPFKKMDTNQGIPLVDDERPVISRDFPPQPETSFEANQDFSESVRLDPGRLSFDYPDSSVQQETLVDAESETRSPKTRDSGKSIILEPISPSVYNLTYACLLIPRFNEHILVGELAERLTDWIAQTCVAFGWRLEHISVHPDYFQWIVNVPPATSPAYLMRILREQTSEKIFLTYPRFSKENPSGDFWAPGYLIMGGSQSPPVQLIREFILQTRQRQGLLERPGS